MAVVSEDISLSGLVTDESRLTEKIRLSDDNEIGLNEARYQFKVENSEQLGSRTRGSVEPEPLTGVVELNIYLEEKSTIITSIAQQIIDSVKSD